MQLPNQHSTLLRRSTHEAVFLASSMIDRCAEAARVTLEEAETPKTPSSPNIRRNTIIGVLAGGVLMVIVVVIVEILDDRVKKPEDIEETLGMTLLGVIPDMSKVG